MYVHSIWKAVILFRLLEGIFSCRSAQVSWRCAARRPSVLLYGVFFKSEGGPKRSEFLRIFFVFFFTMHSQIAPPCVARIYSYLWWCPPGRRPFPRAPVASPASSSAQLSGPFVASLASLDPWNRKSVPFHSFNAAKKTPQKNLSKRLQPVGNLLCCRLAGSRRWWRLLLFAALHFLPLVNLLLCRLHSVMQTEISSCKTLGMSGMWDNQMHFLTL